MSCTSENLWCKEEEVIYKEAEQEYCIFHAPKGKKGCTLEQFNKLIFDRINKAIMSNEPCDLRFTVFEGKINFETINNKRLFPPIYFTSAQFDEVSFGGIQFSGAVDFRVAHLKNAFFNGAKFMGNTDFSGTIFEGETLIWSAQFTCEVSFFQSMFDIVSFEGSEFNGQIRFFETQFKKAFFSDLTIFNKLRFEKMHLGGCFFRGTDMRMIDFINCQWPKKFGRNVLYDELYIFKEITTFDERKQKIESVEVLYRRLKQKFKDEHDESEVSNWHYGEKEMFRKRNRFRRYFPLSLSNLYWFNSGYGERPLRAGIVLGILFLSLSLLIGTTPLVPAGGTPHDAITLVTRLSDIWDITILKVLLLNGLQYATFQKEPIFSPQIQCIGGLSLKSFMQIIIPLQTTLFVLAIRNRFRR